MTAILNGKGVPFNPDQIRTNYVDDGSSGSGGGSGGTGDGTPGDPSAQVVNSLQETGPYLTAGYYEYRISATVAGDLSKPSGTCGATMPSDDVYNVVLNWSAPATNLSITNYVIERRQWAADADPEGDPPGWTVAATITTKGGEPGQISIQRYAESDFRLLGIPLTLG